MVKHKFTVDDYHKAYEVGALGLQRMELLEGEVYIMSPMGNKHRRYIGHLNHELIECLGDKAVIFPQVPIQLNNHSEPEPDFVIANLPTKTYDEHPPMPQDIFFLIEISDTTLTHDHTLKLSQYIKAGISEIWIVNLIEDRLEMFRAPHYAPEYIYKGTKVAPMAFPNDDILWWI